MRIKKGKKMKKVMFGFAAAAAMVAFGDITSSNAVGYQAMNMGTQPFGTAGMCFQTVGAAGDTFRLGDITLKGSTWGSDWLNFINPATSAVDSTKNVTYYSAEEAISDGGSAEDAEWENYDEVCQDDVTYPVGTAFLCNFASKNVQITMAGQVFTTANVVDCSGKSFAFVANLYPGDITAGDIKLEGSTWGSDWLNFINPATSAVDSTKNITYYSAAEAIADGGSEDDAEWEDYDENCKDDVSIPMGSGFLCNFASPNVKVVFPTVSIEK